MRSWYRSSVANFIREPIDSVVGKLTTASVNQGFAVEQPQNSSWIYQIKRLQEILPNNVSLHVFFEFNIPRMGRRIDVVIFGPNSPYIIILEFKVGARVFLKQDKDQALDYALELKNFHKGSHDAKIIPILIATNAKSEFTTIEFSKDNVAQPLLINSQDLEYVLNEIPFSGSVDEEVWENAPYEPTPTIIEAARSLY